MRTKEEIQHQIDGLKSKRKRLPEYSYFGSNNWAVIDTQLSILDGSKKYKDFENAEDEIETAAYEANEWLTNSNTEDLF